MKSNYYGVVRVARPLTKLLQHSYSLSVTRTDQSALRPVWTTSVLRKRKGGHPRQTARRQPTMYLFSCRCHPHPYLEVAYSLPVAYFTAERYGRKLTCLKNITFSTHLYARVIHSKSFVSEASMESVDVLFGPKLYVLYVALLA